MDVLLEATITGAAIFYLVGVFLVLRDDPAQKTYMTIFLGIAMGAVGAGIARGITATWLGRINNRR